MRKKVVGGLATLMVGIVLTGIGITGRYALSADQMVSSNTVRAVSASLFLGVALIMLSAILFIRASGDAKK